MTGHGWRPIGGGLTPSSHSDCSPTRQQPHRLSVSSLSGNVATQWRYLYVFDDPFLAEPEHMSDLVILLGRIWYVRTSYITSYILIRSLRCKSGPPHFDALSPFGPYALESEVRGFVPSYCVVRSAERYLHALNLSGAKTVPRSPR